MHGLNKKLREALRAGGAKTTAGIAACTPNWSSTSTVCCHSGGPICAHAQVGRPLKAECRKQPGSQAPQGGPKMEQ